MTGKRHDPVLYSFASAERITQKLAEIIKLVFHNPEVEGAKTIVLRETKAERNGYALEIQDSETGAKITSIFSADVYPDGMQIAVTHDTSSSSGNPANDNLFQEVVHNTAMRVFGMLSVLLPQVTKRVRGRLESMPDEQFLGNFTSYDSITASSPKILEEAVDALVHRINVSAGQVAIPYINPNFADVVPNPRRPA